MIHVCVCVSMCVQPYPTSVGGRRRGLGLCSSPHMQTRCLRSYTFRQVAAVGSDFHAPLASHPSDSNYSRSIQMTAPVASQAFKQTEKQKEEKGKATFGYIWRLQRSNQCPRNGANEKITALKSHVCAWKGKRLNQCCYFSKCRLWSTFFPQLMVLYLVILHYLSRHFCIFNLCNQLILEAEAH